VPPGLPLLPPRCGWRSGRIRSSGQGLAGAVYSAAWVLVKSRFMLSWTSWRSRSAYRWVSCSIGVGITDQAAEATRDHLERAKLIGDIALTARSPLFFLQFR